MSNVIRFNSWRELMQADLGKIPDQMKEAGLEALNEGADFMVTMAKLRVLTDTFTLQKSIRKEQSGDVVRVLAGGWQFINPKTHKSCTYARHVENKNPFMKPSWDTIQKFMQQLIKDKVIEKVES